MKVLLAAADVIGARRFVTQSIIFGYGYRDLGDRLITEDDPFGEPQGGRVDRHLAAMRSTEQQAFTAPEGIALRYGCSTAATSRRSSRCWPTAGCRSAGAACSAGCITLTPPRPRSPLSTGAGPARPTTSSTIYRSRGPTLFPVHRDGGRGGRPGAAAGFRGG